MLQIFLTSDFNVESAKCECPRGLKICHHIGAAMFASRYEISKTDVSCSWVPPPINVDEIKTCRDVYNIPKTKRVSQRDLLETEISEFKDELTKELCCGFVWLLKDEEHEDDLVCNVLDVRSLISSQEYLTSTNRREFLKTKLKMEITDIQSIANATIGQQANVLWFNVRRCRITGSNFGAVIGSITRNRFPTSLFEKLTTQQNLDGIKAVQWGRTHEKDGILELERYLGKPVLCTGVWLSKAGVLGASPDGFVNDYVVEIKCRFKNRKSSLIADLTMDGSYIIQFSTVTNNWVVNEEHAYYHQIQGQIHLTNKTGCWLVVWTPLETAIVFIAKNESWSHWLEKMENFFFEKLIPCIVGKINE